MTSISEVVDTKQLSYVPDFSVKAVTDLVFVRLRRAHHAAARRATLLEHQQHIDDAGANSVVDKFWMSLDHDVLAAGEGETGSATPQLDVTFPSSHTWLLEGLRVNSAVEPDGYATNRTRPDGVHNVKPGALTDSRA